jgi:hypothetical protein
MSARDSLLKPVRAVQDFSDGPSAEVGGRVDGVQLRQENGWHRLTPRCGKI